MQLAVIALNAIYAVLGVVLMWVSYRMFDRLTPEVDFPPKVLSAASSSLPVSMCAPRIRHLHFSLR